MMRNRLGLVPTRVHGALDVVIALVMIASPWLFKFDHGSSETWLPIFLGGAVLMLGMFTDHELSVARRIPMPWHLLFDIVTGVLLATSPWIFGFASVVSKPHLIIGLSQILVALFTSTQPTEFSLSGTKRWTHAALVLLLLQVRCNTAQSTPREAQPLASIPGFHDPESVLYDAKQDVFFVSNMHGFGSAEDGQGFIVRVQAGNYSRSEVFIASGRAGATLNAPKGMAIRGDVLWVADIDVVRGFDRRTGAAVATVDLQPHRAVMVNDIAVGPDSSLYVTDTGIRMTRDGAIYVGGDRIFAISPDGTVRTFAEGPQLKLPNGIKWDSAGTRWVVVSFDPYQGSIYALSREGGAPRLIARGPARFDGVEILDDGSIVATNWHDHSLHLIRGDRHLRIAGGLQQPADLGLDTRRNRLLVPSVILGRVEVYQLKERS
jgi:sugar lactone lactonase YvrE